MKDATTVYCYRQKPPSEVSADPLLILTIFSNTACSITAVYYSVLLSSISYQKLSALTSPSHALPSTYFSICLLFRSILTKNYLQELHFAIKILDICRLQHFGLIFVLFVDGG